MNPMPFLRRRAVLFPLWWLSMMACWGQVATSPLLISRETNPLIVASSGSFDPVFSADGSTLAFVSRAPDLVTNGIPSQFLNVYVHHLSSGLTTLISARADGRGGGNEDSIFPSLSSNGQRVVFSSLATNLLFDQTDPRRSIYLRDLVAERAQPLGQNTNGLAPNRESILPMLSADGRRVVFWSFATDLVTNKPGNLWPNCYVRDLESGLIELLTATTF